MRHRSAGALFLVVSITLGDAGPVSALTFTCSTVARRGTLAPDGAPFTNRFAEPAINHQGDVLFLGRTAGGVRTVYSYPAAGVPSIVAAENTAAPGGLLFRKFAAPSLNDDGDLAFFAELDFASEGIYLRESGGALVKAVAHADPAPLPGGGLFASFPALSGVNAAGDLAFIATVSGGPDGVFRYDASAATLVPIARIGDATGDGRQFCAFLGVGLGDGGNAVLNVRTKVDCADPLETDLGIVYQQAGAGFVAVARQGDPTPLVGTTYDEFFDADLNAADQVAFRAKTVGLFRAVAVFLFDATVPTTTRLVQTGEPAPATGGPFKTISRIAVTDGGRVGFRGRAIGGTSRFGLFLFGGGEAVVVETSPVPTDLYATGALYRQIDELVGFDRSGTRATYSAKVRDALSPHAKSGVFRCEGS